MNNIINFTKDKRIQRKTAFSCYTLDDYEFTCKTTELLFQAVNPLTPNYKEFTCDITEISLEEERLRTMTTEELIQEIIDKQPKESEPSPDDLSRYKYQACYDPIEISEAFDPWAPCNDNDPPD